MTIIVMFVFASECRRIVRRNLFFMVARARSSASPPSPSPARGADRSVRAVPVLSALLFGRGSSVGPWPAPVPRGGSTHARTHAHERHYL